MMTQYMNDGKSFPESYRAAHLWTPIHNTALYFHSMVLHHLKRIVPSDCLQSDQHQSTLMI